MHELPSIIPLILDRPEACGKPLTTLNMLRHCSNQHAYALLFRAVPISAHSADGRCRLSMGMSSDLEAAVAEGADVVRVGTALYEGLDTAADRRDAPEVASWWRATAIA